MQRATVLGAVFSLSVGAHLALGASIAAIPKDAGKKQSFVSVVEKKRKKQDEDKKEPPKDEPPPPPKPKEPPRSAPKPKAAPENTPPPPANPPPPSAAAHPQLAALPNLNISMAGGPGAAGIAIPAATAAQDPGPASSATALKAARPKDDCAEEAVKPKLVGSIPQDRIIAAAQAAGGVEGRIRLELLVDESGNVSSVRVMSGLGGAVDAAAVAAAKRVKATASTKCGRPVAGRLVVAMTIRNPE